MRAKASELLASEVVDVAGRRLGPVRDVRLSREGFRVVGLVVGEGPFARIAHGWGYAEGRARGPALIAATCRSTIRRARWPGRAGRLPKSPAALRNISADSKRRGTSLTCTRKSCGSHTLGCRCPRRS